MHYVTGCTMVKRWLDVCQSHRKWKKEPMNYFLKYLPRSISGTCVHFIGKPTGKGRLYIKTRNSGVRKNRELIDQ
jgi:hypothetical protein